MKKLNRDDIQILNKHCDLNTEEITLILQENIHPTPKDWQYYLKLIFLSIGIGFFASGVMFFFAYNWEEMTKFTKLSIIQGLVLVTVLGFQFFKTKPIVSKIISTGLAFLIGVMFAVFGQIYQTGANAYDFFLMWSISITVIVIATDFSVLWLLYILLLSTTFHFYVYQAAENLNEMEEALFLFIFYTLIYVLSLFTKSRAYKIPNWWFNVFTFCITGLGTKVFTFSLFDNGNPILNVFFVLLTLSIYLAGLLFANQKKRIVEISFLSFSLIIMFTAVIIKVGSDAFGIFFMCSIFVIVSVSLLVQKIISLQKKWNNGTV